MRKWLACSLRVSGRGVGPLSGHTKDGNIDISCFVVNHAAQRSKNYICEEMASVLVSSAVDRGFGSRSGQTKQYTSAASPLRTQLLGSPWISTSKYWLVRNQDNVFEWSDMSTRVLLFQWVGTIKVQLSVLV